MAPSSIDPRTVEAHLLEALQLLAPGKYRRLSYEQRVKCHGALNHLKGGSRRLSVGGKDYNLSVFTFPTGVTEIKCLYNCGLKVRSDEGRKEDFEDLAGLMKVQSTNSNNSAEIGPWRDPGPAPVYTDADRQRIRDNAEMFLKWLEVKIEKGEQVSEYILGGIKDHPDPIVAPESIVESQLKTILFRGKRERKFQKAVAEAKQAAEKESQVPEPCKTTVSKRKTKSRRIRVG